MPFYLKGVFSRQFRTLYQVGGGGRPPKSAVGLFVRVTRQSAKWSVFLIPSCNPKIWSFSATRTVLCLRWWWDFFFENCRVAGALQTTVGVKFRDFVAKVQLIEFLAILFVIFQLSHHLCEGGYTCDQGDAKILKKSHHHRKQIIARVAEA